MTSALASYTHIIFQLLVDHLEDWPQNEVVQLSMVCKTAKQACSNIVNWLKIHRWHNYHSLPYRGRQIQTKIMDTYLVPTQFHKLVATLNEAQKHMLCKFNIVCESLSFIEPDTLCSIPVEPDSRILCNTIHLLTSLAKAQHKNSFATQVFALAAHKYRQFRLADPDLMFEEHVALYRSMNLLASILLRKGPSSLLNVYIAHYIRFYNSDKRIRRINVWDL